MPIGLAVLMAATIGFGVFESPHSSANAIPAPAQYTGTNTTANPFSDPLVIAGVALGILVIVFAVLLAFRLRGSRMSGGGEGEGEGGDDGKGASEAEDEDEEGEEEAPEEETSEPEA